MKSTTKAKALLICLGFTGALLHAKHCSVTLSKPCATGATTYPGTCSDGTKSKYVLSDGNDVNKCFSGYDGGSPGCKDEAEVDCTQTFTATTCSGTTNTGSIANKVTPTSGTLGNCNHNG